MGGWEMRNRQVDGYRRSGSRPRGAMATPPWRQAARRHGWTMLVLLIAMLAAVSEVAA